MTFGRTLAAAVLWCGLGCGLDTDLGSSAAQAQVYPDRLIKVIVPFVPGSPVDAAAKVLGHLAAAFKISLEVPLDQQEVIVTVPASFDAAARDLTLEAAARAGLPKVTLLEEPQAALYAWLEAMGEGFRKQVKPGDVLLVVNWCKWCDVMVGAFLGWQEACCSPARHHLHEWRDTRSTPRVRFVVCATRPASVVETAVGRSRGDAGAGAVCVGQVRRRAEGHVRGRGGGAGFSRRRRGWARCRRRGRVWRRW